ncbi:MAG TPA: helix-turn-helix transcriptional regulator [Polyangiaceae bacterium]|nr:helix-turn-helix transcriptional regulator [Polyangiaceae bacterium]
MLPSSHDYLAAVEAAYDLRTTEHEWVTQIARAVRPALDRGLGVAVYTYDANQTAPLRYGPVGMAGEPAWLGTAVTQFAASLSDSELQRLYLAHSAIENLSRIRRTLRLSVGPLQLMEKLGVADATAMRAHNANQRSLIVIACSKSRCEAVHPRRQSELTRVAAHFAAATRLRFSTIDSESPAAVLSGTGQLEHGGLDAQAARLRLQAAVRALTKAQSIRRRDPVEALELWRAMVAGRWSLVSHIDTDGKRLVLARRNAPNVKEPAGLTDDERAVALLAAWGHSNKLITYELGFGASKVSTLLRSAMRKLRVPSRAKLAALFPNSPAPPAQHPHTDKQT